MNTACEGNDSVFSFSPWPISEKMDKNTNTKSENVKTSVKKCCTSNPVIFKDDSISSTSFSSNKTIYSNSLAESLKPVKPKTRRQDLLEPFSNPWMVQRIREDSDSQVRPVLLSLIPEGRREEVTDELLEEIRRMGKEDAEVAVGMMREPIRFVKGGRGRQLTVPVTVTRLDNSSRIGTRALVDSGCTGSCINQRFVIDYQIPTRKTPLAIPVYNADSTLNKNGSIREFATLQLTIDDHSERIDLAVTDLGDTDLFLGHDWLKIHNPSIDWTDATLCFNRCSAQCGYNQTNREREQDVEIGLNPEDDLKPGDRIFFFDWDRYVEKNCRIVQRRPQEVTPDYVRDFPEVFSEEEFDHLPERRPWDHAIELTPGFSPADCKVYPLNREEQRVLDEFLAENLRNGRIRPSKSPMASPFFFVKKKDGKLRPVQDYRKLNQGTVKNKYPLPLIQELIDKTKQAKYFTKLDVRWGYNNIRIKEGDEWKAAFKTNRGLFEPTVMFFGLTNSPATFQSFMNSILKDLVDEGHVIVYLDDILIYTMDLKEHDRIVRQVLEILKRNRLYLRFEKCTFAQSTIEYLGFIVGNGEIRMDAKKVEAIQTWPEPKNLTNVQSFLGFCNFYRRFIKDFSKIARPLNRLTGNVEWQWGEEERKAFEGLKEAVKTFPVLAVPTDEDPFRVESDASDFAVGAILSQKQEGKWRPIAYFSQSMSQAERNYAIYDKEMLAIMLALREWRQYLLGAKHPVEVWTDHKNLSYFKAPQDLNRRQARWVTELADYDLRIVPKAGKEMKKADLLSRRADHERGENDNKNVTLLKPEWFIHDVTIESLDTNLVQRIKDSRKPMDKSVKKALDTGNKEWRREDEGLVFWEHRLYVPRDAKLREDIIRVHHDDPLAGHPGRHKTHELITRSYWWPGISAQVRMYVSGCEACQRTKAHRERKHAPLNPNEIPSEPWEVISVDLIGELPESRGFNAICVIVDRFSKQIHAIPTNTELTSEGMAKIYRDQVFRLHGIPRKVISDRGPQFESSFMKDLYRLLGIEANPSTAYHPQTDGQTERINQEIEQYLRIYVNFRQNDWADWLAIAEFAYNDKVQASTGHSPFFVNHGRHPYKGSNPRVIARNESAQQFKERMGKVQEEVGASLKMAAETMKRFYDRTKGESIAYKKGDKVWLEATNITTKRPMKKLDDKRLGPFTIVDKVGKAAYKLKLPDSWRIHPVFNEVLLSPYHTPQFESQQRPPPPPPEIVDGNEEWEVEEVLGARLVGRGALQFKVKWKGYLHEHDQWLLASYLKNAPEVVAEFYQQSPLAPHKLYSVDFQQLPFQPVYQFTDPFVE